MVNSTVFPSPCLAVPLAAIALGAIVISPAQAQTIETADVRATLLADIAFEYAALNHTQRWNTVANQALESTQAMVFQCFQANPLAKVAGSYLLIGQERQGQTLLAEAIATAQRQADTGCSSSATSPTESLLNRAREYAEAGHLDLALELGRSLGDPIALADLAGHLAGAGRGRRAAELLDQAIAQAQTIPVADTDYRSLTLVAIAERLRGAGHSHLARQVLDAALESTNTLGASEGSASMQILARLRMARELAAIDAGTEAIAVLDQTLPQIEALPAQPYALDPTIYAIDAALLWAELGQRPQAEAILATTLTAAQALPEDTGYSRGDALGRVAAAYARLGDLEQARPIVQAIQPGIERELAFQQMAIAQAEAGDLAAAVALAQASGSRRNTALVEITRYHLANQQPDQAWALVQAEQVQGIFAEVALGYLEAGQPDQAWQIVQANGLEGFDSELAIAQARAGQADQAIAAQPVEWLRPAIAREFAQQRQLDLALQVAESIGDQTYRAQAFIAIAQSYGPPAAARRGGVRGAIATLTDAARGWFGDSNRETATAALDQALELTQSL
ncbi:hypothetical protein [Leptolyngbya sp. KIOST-1]|uniref:hypothetical protein n=1 Tax=Leptolyngbya sp. KIOST-1 TaxID=1229172 RepID=UPI00056AC233|nr:hypothetical protein [Leptolyngbya sp. KIOST-1]